MVEPNVIEFLDRRNDCKCLGLLVDCWVNPSVLDRVELVTMLLNKEGLNSSSTNSGKWKAGLSSSTLLLIHRSETLFNYCVLHHRNHCCVLHHHWVHGQVCVYLGTTFCRELGGDQPRMVETINAFERNQCVWEEMILVESFEKEGAAA